MRKVLFLSALVMSASLGQARGLPPPSTSKDTEVVENTCPTYNKFGMQIASQSSRSEILKILKMKSDASQNMTTEKMQSLKDQFMQATSVFKNTFDLDSASTPSLVQTRARLLGSVGYNEARLDKAMKSELMRLALEDPRWKNALQKLTCNLQNCKSTEGLAIAYDTLIAGKSFKHELENSLLEQAREGLTVDEMLGGQIIPNERARLRLFSALLNQLGVQNEIAWSCSRNPTSIDFSARLEVKIGNDAWTSDTALSNDFKQRSTQLCFSSLTQLTEQCLSKKGASL